MLGTSAMKYFFYEQQWNLQYGVKWQQRVPWIFYLHFFILLFAISSEFQLEKITGLFCAHMKAGPCIKHLYDPEFCDLAEHKGRAET